MSHRRQRLSQARASLHDLASDLGGLALDVESRNARTMIERARKLIQAAHAEIDLAMREPLDAPASPAGRKDLGVRQ